MEIAKQLKEQLGEKLEEHLGLRDYTTMKVGGVADYVFSASTVSELVNAVQAAVNLDIPYLVLGGGSNVIISDYGFPGMVIFNRSSNVAFLQDRSQVMSDSGVYLSHLITSAAAKEYGGLEFLVGVPGTVGGAAYNNVSCWGGEFSDYVRSLTILLPGEEKGERCRTVNIEAQDMKFGYHSSWLKENSGKNVGRKPVILSVKLQLASLRREEIMRRIKQYQQMRLSKQPLGEHSAGSIFKNPSGFEATASEDKNYSAGFLIDKSGGKRLRVGGAQVSKKHANFIVNTGKATAMDVRQLIEQIQELVREKKGITLEEEIEFIGEWSKEQG
ncbi:MAG: UDP-N-acetylmuramate dehydrogenase [bacterium]|nr:UDP-N-acetylmuramate dehydrogenase [bacterium]